MIEPNADFETRLQVSCTVAAPREKVFRAWTEPETLKKWWGPAGGSTPVVEIDLRVGGHYRFGMQFPGQDIFYVSGAYLEVQPPEKLVFTWRWEKPDMDFGDSQVTIEFHQRDNATEVTLRHEYFPTSEICEKHRLGWNDFLEKFLRLVESKEV